MKRLSFDPSWPESWRYSFPYDELEVWGGLANRGYAYQYAERHRHALGLVARAHRPPARVLDIAGAQGNFTLALAEAGYEVTWNDLRADLEGYVRLKHERGTVHYAPGNAFELGFRECFEIVLITEVIEHVAHPDDFLRKAATLVPPGGHIVMTTPNGRYFRNPLPRFFDCPDPSVFEAQQFKPDADGHIFLLHPDEVPPLAAKAGLQLVELRVYTNSLTGGCLGTGPLLKVLPRGLVEAGERLTQRLPAAVRDSISTGLAALFRRPAGA
ncbi:MAG TPA: methyltransferase domain-containing protein [Verrucomicrobiota bacterium]|nr:methyltransferase domain-containing protein [Verrucomicrobiota bacterium]